MTPRELAEKIVGELKCKHCDGGGYVGGGYDPETGDCDPGRPCICTGNGQHEPFPVSEIVDCPTLINSIDTALTSERAKVERLREALLKYGEHSTECRGTRRGTPCICGFDTALKETP